MKNPCMNCKNAYAGKCCWIDEIRCVPGWKATWVKGGVSLKTGHFKPSTYQIESCPNFIEDEESEKQEKGRPRQNTNCQGGLKRLCELSQKLKKQITNFNEDHSEVVCNAPDYTAIHALKEIHKVLKESIQ